MRRSGSKGSMPRTSRDRLRARPKQAKAGIQPIDFGPEESKKFLEKANEVAWQSVIKRAPETGAKLRQFSGN
jgi:hypothetical protein